MRVHDTEDHAVLQELRGPVEAVIAPLPAVQVVTQTVAEIILAQLMGLTVERKLPILYPSLLYNGTLILMFRNIAPHPAPLSTHLLVNLPVVPQKKGFPVPSYPDGESNPSITSLLGRSSSAPG